MKDTPVSYRALKTAIEGAKLFLPGLRQSDIDRIFFEAQPYFMTKFSISVAKQLYYNNHDLMALGLLQIAKVALGREIYHNFLICKVYCYDKLQDCENEIKKNQRYHTTTTSTPPQGINPGHNQQSVYHNRSTLFGSLSPNRDTSNHDTATNRRSYQR